MDEGAAPPLPIGKPSYEGSLYKRSEWLQQWRQRYFKLYLGPSGPRLYFCKDAESPPHGAIDLRQCLTVKSADDKTGKKNSFEVSTSEQHFFMYANTAQEKDDWVGQLGRAIVMASKGPAQHREEEEDDEDYDDDDE